MTKAKMKEPAPEGDLLSAVAPKTAKQAKPQPAPPAKPPAKVKAVAKAETLPAVVPPKTTNLLAAIIQAAADPACNPEKMHALLDARGRLMAEEAHVAFVIAYIAMQDELPTINATGKIEIEGRSGKRGQNTPYATFQEINRVTKPILAKHHFGMMMLPDVGPGNVGVLMRGHLAYVCDTQYGKLVHVERCAIAAPLEAGGSKNNVQGIGSSLSYTKRYTAIALLNLVSHAPEDKDDDAKAAGGVRTIKTISALQAAELTEAIKDCGVAEETFRSKFEVEKIEDLPVAKLEEALTACANFKKNRIAATGARGA